MVDFIYYTPTEVAFGKNSEEQTARLVKKYGGTKVLLHYGGQSAVRSGLIDKIGSLLKEEGIPFITLGGVVPNPRVSLVRKGIELSRREGVDLVLAVGGGSVIDSSKAIAYGLAYDGDVWDFFEGTAVPKACYPVGAVVTLPAAGSEMSDSCVISDDEKNLKRGVNSNLVRCKFAVMNPERTFTLPPFQTACGATDIMMHTMERYFSKDVDMTLTDEIAEALMRTVKESVFYVLKDPCDYRHRAQIMWASSLSHNDLTGCGTRRDFASHKLEHEISALFDVAHGAGLSAIWGSWARYVMKENVSRFVRFAVNVMGVTNDYTDPEGTALRGIEAMERFYHAINMPTCITELIGRKFTEEELDQLARQCSRDGSITIGGFKVLHQSEMREVYALANH
jgi:alcohol dehydrogenase YqhD (iron-dependent ADH family)